jgi:uncharacterized membrane protein
MTEMKTRGGPMIDGYLRSLTIVAAVGAGLSAGVFFAFSTFVMKALGRLPASEGLQAMNAINKAAPTPLFMLPLFGTAVLCVILSVNALRHLDQRWAVFVLIGSVLYVACVVLTIVYHVPRNDALARVDPHGPEAARAWAGYLQPWTAWNHVRSVTALAGAVALILAL